MVTALLRLDAAGGLGAFLLSVLHDGRHVEVGTDQFVDRFVVLEKMWAVNLEGRFVGLLVEIDGADAVLHLLEVGGDVDDVVHRAHVAEEAQVAALGEFDEFLGNPDFVQIGAAEVAADEHVSRNAGDVLFDQRVLAHEIIDAERGKQMLEFQSVDA